MSALRPRTALLLGWLVASCSLPDELASRDASRDVIDAALDALGIEGGSRADSAMEASADSSAPRDSGADVPTVPMGDSMPRDTVLFFNTMACPTGWEPYNEAAGRVIVPTMTGAMPNDVRGLPLRDAEDRTHAHDVSETFAIDSVSYVGIAGGSNRGVASADDPSMMVRSEPASAGLPYVQLLACKKTTNPVARVTPVPSGMLIFVAATSCPTGYTQPMATAGRAPVGTPPAGTDLATVGPAYDDSASRNHHHAVSATLTTSPHGIGLASGCCGSGYARNDVVRAADPTSDEDGSLPTLTLLQCQKD